MPKAIEAPDNDFLMAAGITAVITEMSGFKNGFI
jgi:hypothetical protein